MTKDIKPTEIIGTISRINTAIIKCTEREDWEQDGEKMLIKMSGFEKIARLFDIAYDITQSNGRCCGRFAIGNAEGIEVEAPSQIEVINNGLGRILLGFRLLTQAQIHRYTVTTAQDTVE